MYIDIGYNENRQTLTLFTYIYTVGTRLFILLHSHGEKSKHYTVFGTQPSNYLDFILDTDGL